MFFAVSLPSAFGEITDEDKIDRLEAHLTVIENSARSDRIIGGSVLIGAGALVSVGGILVTESTDIPREEKTILDIALGGSGVICVGLGIFLFAVPSEYETIPREYRNMPQRTEDQVRSKANKGEVYLENFAKTAEFNRYLGGGILIATGIGEIIASFFYPDPSGEYYAAMRNSFLYTGILNCGLGILNFFIKTPIENEYNSYKEWKKQSGTAQKQETTSYRLSILPNPFGVTASFKINF